jgi:cysteinyl-tRNA synthetase
MKNGHAYISKVDGSVYFDVKSYPDYLKLSGHNMDSLLENVTQGEELDAKRDPRDFALWKAAKPGEPTWPFTQTDDEVGKYGRVASGRPGWHIECSVMSAKYLGPSFDIHGGGKELKFPHHENELAQAKCGHPDEDFARIWMHNEWVVLPSGEKMAKSGESVLIRDVLKNHDPDTVRMFILSGHYRKEIAYSQEGLEDQAKAKARIVETFRRLTEFLRWRAEERHENWLQIWEKWDIEQGFDIQAFVKRMHDNAPRETKEITTAYDLVMDAREALYTAHLRFADDFDTQGPMGELFRLVTRINASLDKMSPDNVYDFDAANIALGALVYLIEIFSILKSERDSLYMTPEAREEIAKGGGDAAKLADVLLKLREDARLNKDFKLADKIRDRLSEIGAEVRDSKDGPKIMWKEDHV